MIRTRWAVPGIGLLALMLLVACSSQPASQEGSAAPSSQWLALKGFTLIDGTGAEPVSDAALLAENGRITWVGKSADLKAPAGVNVQDLSGKYVMPGIINLHGHVAESDGLTQDPKKLFTRENVEKNLRLYAEYGVTSVASLGTDQPQVYELREEFRKEKLPITRLFTAGRGFTVKGGYPSMPGAVPGVPYEVSDPKQATAEVDEVASHHPDLIKMWVDSHFGTLPKLPISISRAIIDEAHKDHLKAVAHIFELRDAKELADAGLDGFAHSVRDKAIDDELIRSMKQHGTWQMSATLAREASMFAFANPDRFVNDPFFTHAVPENVLANMKSPAYHKTLVSDPHFREYPTFLKNAEQNLKRLADAGVRFGFGTDTGPPYRFAGFGEHWEMELMVEAGLTPMQVITAATGSSAQFLGALDLGTLQPGKWADLIVLGASPLADIKNTRKIDAVYIGGQKVQASQELSANARPQQ